MTLALRYRWIAKRSSHFNVLLIVRDKVTRYCKIRMVLNVHRNHKAY